MQVFTVVIASEEESDRTGLEAGAYCVHVGNETATLMFRPVGERTFRIGTAMVAE